MYEWMEKHTMSFVGKIQQHKNVDYVQINMAVQCSTVIDTEMSYPDPNLPSRKSLVPSVNSVTSADSPIPWGHAPAGMALRGMSEVGL